MRTFLLASFLLPYMPILETILIVIGLCLFETITSLDNAVINAEVLSSMSAKAKRWFLSWGLIFAVFIIRGLLPFIIMWISNPNLGLTQLFHILFSQSPEVMKAVEESAPLLLIGGGTFLIFLFFHWLFLEPKNFGLKGELFFHRQGIWFYAVVSVLLTSFVCFSVQINPLMAIGAVIGSTAFFITHGFKENAAQMEERMLEGKTKMTDLSKILYLEVIDATFSVDGVLGAFAFTMSVPLILIGNGLGAFVIRGLTIKSIDKIKKLKYLKNGAMYSIFILGVLMVSESFGFKVPSLVSPISTLIVIGFFFYKSIREKE
jgi:hypothetical protein